MAQTFINYNATRMYFKTRIVILVYYYRQMDVEHFTVFCPWSTWEAKMFKDIRDILL